MLYLKFADIKGQLIESKPDYKNTELWFQWHNVPNNEKKIQPMLSFNVLDNYSNLFRKYLGKYLRW